MSGAEQFKEWIDRREFKTYTQAAAYLGLDKSIVTKLANGRRAPGRTNALLLERKTGVPVEAWSSESTDTSRKRRRENGRKRKTDK